MRYKKEIVCSVVVSLLLHTGIVFFVLRESVPEKEIRKITWVSLRPTFGGRKPVADGARYGEGRHISGGGAAGHAKADETQRGETHKKSSSHQENLAVEKKRLGDESRAVASKGKEEKSKEKVQVADRGQKMDNEDKSRKEGETKIKRPKENEIRRSKLKQAKDIERKGKRENKISSAYEDKRSTKTRVAKNRKVFGEPTSYSDAKMTKGKHRRDVHGEIAEISPTRSDVISRDEIERRIKELYNLYETQGEEGGGLYHGGVQAGEVGGAQEGGHYDKVKFSYIELISDLVRNSYEIPKFFKDTKLSCVVYISISADGSINEVKVEKPSGNKSFDSFVLKVVQESAPFPPPPEEMKLLIRFSTYD